MLDEFNLKGLSSYVPDIKKVIFYILDYELPDGSKDEEMDETPETLQNNAVLIYGLIHARYILTKRGLKQMVLIASHVVVAEVPKDNV